MYKKFPFFKTSTQDQAVQWKMGNDSMTVILSLSHYAFSAQQHQVLFQVLGTQQWMNKPCRQSTLIWGGGETDNNQTIYSGNNSNNSATKKNEVGWGDRQCSVGREQCCLFTRMINFSEEVAHERDPDKVWSTQRRQQSGPQQVPRPGGECTLGALWESTEACVAEAEWMRVRMRAGTEVTDVATGYTGRTLVSFRKGLDF